MKLTDAQFDEICDLLDEVESSIRQWRRISYGGDAGDLAQELRDAARSIEEIAR